MWRSSKVRFDVATALDRGDRDNQEDAVVADFPVGSDCGMAVLADGMGGHAAGGTASALVVGTVFAELKTRATAFPDREGEVPQTLRAAAVAANAGIDRHIAAHPQTRSMGSTLVAATLVGPHLYWASVGDSPLYLHRGRTISRLNENHSMAAQIDTMIALGQIKPEVGRTHPDRSCLTSAITGQKITRINCPVTPQRLAAGDIVLIASDGLQTLGDAEIEQVLRRHARRPSLDIAEALLDAVRDRNLAEQDNTSIVVIKVLLDKPLARQTLPPLEKPTEARADDAMEVFDAIALDSDDTDLPARRAASR
jgi:PPM family protein phosphatase